MAQIALLRICEFTVADKDSSETVLSNKDIFVCTFDFLRLSKKRLGTHVDINVENQNKFCDDQLFTYQNLQANNHWSIFCHFDGSPLTSYQFDVVLKKALNSTEMKDSYFKSHLFRIGALYISLNTVVSKTT